MRLMLLGAALLTGCATEVVDETPAMRVVGRQIVAGQAAVTAPVRLDGCESGRIMTPDPVDGVAEYICAHGATVTVWTRELGWEDADDAFDNAFDLLPDNGARWRRSGEPVEQRLPTLYGEQAFLTLSAGDEGYRSNRGQERTWKVPAARRPRVVFQASWEGSDPEAGTAAMAALDALIARSSY